MSPLPPVSSSFGLKVQGFPGLPKREDQEGRKAPSLVEGLGLTPEEQRVVAELKAIDAKVRAHEQAHLAAAGGLAKGGASYSYTRGPDGKQYATGGEVAIDTSGVPGNPKATLAKAERIRAAALAPANPSAQDRAVAAAAASLAAQAQLELSQQQEAYGEDGKAASKTAKGLQLDVIV